MAMTNRGATVRNADSRRSRSQPMLRQPVAFRVQAFSTSQVMDPVSWPGADIVTAGPGRSPALLQRTQIRTRQEPPPAPAVPSLCRLFAWLNAIWSTDGDQRKSAAAACAGADIHRSNHRVDGPRTGGRRLLADPARRLVLLPGRRGGAIGYGVVAGGAPRRSALDLRRIAARHDGVGHLGGRAGFLVAGAPRRYSGAARRLVTVALHHVPSWPRLTRPASCTGWRVGARARGARRIAHLRSA